MLAGICDALTLGGWRWFHIRRSDKAVQQGHPGLPDIIAVHTGRRMVWAGELKSAHGRLTESQKEWLGALTGVPGVRADVVRPAGYDAVVRWLLLVGGIR